MGNFPASGATGLLHSDVRILAATNKRLEEEVENQSFREDLFYRLNVVRIHIPPLRRRVEDVRLLAEFFLQKRTGSGKSRAMRFSKKAMEMLEGHHWPGNVRELENLVHAPVCLRPGMSSSRPICPLIRAEETNPKNPSSIALRGNSYVSRQRLDLPQLR